MNVGNFIGRIGRDAVQRFTPNGKPVTSWSLAVDVGFGENKQTLWLDCAGWGERYGKLADYIKKGDRLGVTGEIGTREHDGKTYVTLNVRDVTLLGDKKGDARPASKPSQPDHGKPTLDDDEIPFAPRGKRNHWE